MTFQQVNTVYDRLRAQGSIKRPVLGKKIFSRHPGPFKLLVLTKGKEGF